MFEDFQILDVTGPLEVFSQATRLIESRGGRGPGYRTRLVAHPGGLVRSSSGVTLLTNALARTPAARIDTLLVSGGRGVERAVRDRKLLTWIQKAAGPCRRTASVCSGAFLLAEAGLLDGRSATTHWEACDALSRYFPKVRVERDRIFVKDGSVYTSAGVTAGIDLALALVAEDHGRALALAVARQLVVFLQRPGGQSQFSAQLAVQTEDREPLADLRAWMEDHVARDLSVPVLARRAGMSPRNFARRFTEQVGKTPGRYVRAVRVAAARRRLEESAHGLDKVAADAGFGTADVLRRVFLAELGTTPSEYRARFSTKGASA